ncbi:NADAR family protein [Prevotella koreensis]
MNLKERLIKKEYYSLYNVLTFNGKSQWKFGNMKTGFPFKILGKTFLNSESAYICGLTSDIDLQNELLKTNNGFIAKKFIRKPKEHLIRTDHNSYNVDWMLYVIWCKCTENKEFKELLLSVPNDKIIIEDSTSIKGLNAYFWGCKLIDNKYIGHNIMGKILIYCRYCLMKGIMPQINFNLLNESYIMWFGKKLFFGNKREWMRFYNIDEYKYYESETNPSSNYLFVD